MYRALDRTMESAQKHGAEEAGAHPNRKDTKSLQVSAKAC